MWIVSLDKKDILITDKEDVAWGIAGIFCQYLAPEHKRKVSLEKATTLVFLGLPFKPIEPDSILGNGTDYEWIRIKSEEEK